MTSRRGSSGTADLVDGEESGTGKARRVAVRVACNACRAKKIKCDGQRPRCGWCASHPNVPCVYDTDNSEETRSAAMKRENENLKASLARAEDVLRQLFTLPEDESILLLKRLRTAKGLPANPISSQPYPQYQQQGMSGMNETVRAGPDEGPAMDGIMYDPRPGVGRMYPDNTMGQQMAGFGYDQTLAGGAVPGGQRSAHAGPITLPPNAQAGQQQNVDGFYDRDDRYVPGQ